LISNELFSFAQSLTLDELKFLFADSAT